MGPGGARAMFAESLPVRQQLLTLNRSRERAPNLSPLDRVIAGLCTLFMLPSRVVQSAVILKTSTLLPFHAAFAQVISRIWTETS